MLAADYEKIVLVSTLAEHKKEAAVARPKAIISIIGLILVDAFPLYCYWGWVPHISGFWTYYEGGIFTTLYLIILTIFFAGMAYLAHINVEGVEESHQEFMKTQELKRKEQENIIKEENKKRNAIEQLGGDVVKLHYFTREFNYYSGENDRWKTDLFFSKNYTKFYDGKKVRTNAQILDYKVLENNLTYDNGAVSRTTIDNGNMLKRAIVGGVVSGGIGAVIGAATASRTTSTDGIVLHMTEYQIEITLDDAKCPVLNLYFRDNKNLMKSVERILIKILPKFRNKMRKSTKIKKPNT